MAKEAWRARGVSYRYLHFGFCEIADRAQQVVVVQGEGGEGGRGRCSGGRRSTCGCRPFGLTLLLLACALLVDRRHLFQRSHARLPPLQLRCCPLLSGSAQIATRAAGPPCRAAAAEVRATGAHCHIERASGVGQSGQQHEEEEGEGRPHQSPRAVAGRTRGDRLKLIASASHQHACFTAVTDTSTRLAMCLTMSTCSTIVVSAVPVR